MSEAAIAAPETKAPAPAPGAITIDLGNLGKKAVKEQPPTATDEKPPVEQPKGTTDEKPAETKSVENTPSATEKKPNDKEHNMAELRKAREAAESARKEVEAERDRIKAELESLRTKSPELPEDVKTRLSAIEQLEKERAELRQRLSQADLARDPEFQAKYNTQITSKIQSMGDAAIAAGVTQEDWKRAVSNWNEEQFAEWSEAMSPVQRIKFTNAWTQAVDLYQQQQTELANAEKTYQDLLKTRQAESEAQQKQYFTQTEQLAKSVLAEVLKPDSTKEWGDLPSAAEAIVLKAARHELTPKEVFEQLAHNQVLARVTQKQKSEIEELKAQLAERDKKIAEQDSFITNQAGSVPRGDAAGATTPTNDNTPLWKQIQVKA